MNRGPRRIRRYALAGAMLAQSAGAFAHRSTAVALLQPLALVSAGQQDDGNDVSALTAAIDLNRDGILDVVEVKLPAENDPGHAMLLIQLGKAGGGFVETSNLALPGRDPRTIIAGDFNHDGIPDVMVGDGEGALSEFLGDGKGQLVPAGEIAHLSSVVSVTAADFNHDGKVDLAVSDSRTGTVTILLGSGTGAFQQGWAFRLPMPGKVYRLAAADFNGDGMPDLAVSNEDGDAYEVMLGNGNGTFTSSPELSHLQDPNAHCVT